MFLVETGEKIEVTGTIDPESVIVRTPSSLSSPSPFKERGTGGEVNY